ncbi:hypothetical protein TNCV_2332021 [Trichonephila clavipes]|nr:hypothetical protein TNCV_2332021 [Trichonephila clavipes]
MLGGYAQEVSQEVTIICDRMIVYHDNVSRRLPQTGKIDNLWGTSDLNRLLDLWIVRESHYLGWDEVSDWLEARR